MHRFFLPAEYIQKQDVIFPKEISHQILRVLRIKPADHVTILDNTGKEYEVELVDVSSTVTGKVLSIHELMRDIEIRLHLFFAVSHRERVELILQKCTEIGVGDFTPILTGRTIVREKAIVNEKQKRWQAIIREAAEQSERGWLPMLHPAANFSEAIVSDLQFDMKLIAWEEEKIKFIRSLNPLKKNARVGLIIGPEGGFSQDEVKQAILKGWESISLGKTILRMETAAIVASALILDHFSGN
jgi:16S rRNA (uracil1498-N3)-methyltransferase